MWIVVVTPGIYSFSLIVNKESASDGTYLFDSLETLITMFKDLLLIETGVLWVHPELYVFILLVSFSFAALFFHNIYVGTLVLILFSIIRCIVGPWFIESALNIMPRTLYHMIGCGVLASLIMATLEVNIT